MAACRPAGDRCVKKEQFYQRLEQFYSEKLLQKSHAKNEIEEIVKEIQVAKQKT